MPPAQDKPTRWMRRIVLSVAIAGVIASIAGIATVGLWKHRSNQYQPLASPSGRYVLAVLVEDSGARWKDMWGRHPKIRRVTIAARDGTAVYRDPTDYPPDQPRFHYAWDANDRAWLYHGETHAVWFYENVGGTWQKEKWGYGRTRRSDRDITPPAALYPNGAR